MIAITRVIAPFIPRNGDPYHRLSCDHQKSPDYCTSASAMTSRFPERWDTLAPLPVSISLGHIGIMVTITTVSLLWHPECSLVSRGAALVNFLFGKAVILPK